MRDERVNIIMTDESDTRCWTPNTEHVEDNGKIKLLEVCWVLSTSTQFPLNLVFINVIHCGPLSTGHFPFCSGRSTANGDIVNKSILTQLTSQAVVFIPNPIPSSDCKRICKIISMLMTNKVIK